MSEINTIQDLMDICYPPDRLMHEVDFSKILRKADDPVLYNTTGWTNLVYGRAVFNWLNESSDIWKLLPKKPWGDHSGWRVITTDESGSAGVTNTGSLPDSDKPTWAQLYAYPKYMMSRWDISEKAHFLSDKDDTITNAELKAYYTKRHPKAIDEWLGTAYQGDASEVTTGTYVIESIDRVVGSYSEATACYTTGTNADVYNFTYARHGNTTTYDAYVDHNSTTDRVLELGFIDDLIENADTYGAKRENLIFLTKHDTKMEWNALLEGKQRFMEKKNVSYTMNGVKSAVGTDAGFEVASYDSIPIFTSNNIAADGIGRVYLLDLEHLYIAVALPTLLLETKRQDFLLNDKLQTKHAYMTGCELRCTKFKSQGKVIDLKAA
jgi:hypothetical protein